ncbi:MAG: prepilin-type N-terminal cleavage/methylation domain-containing protein [Alphaproteobacteria bacterium]|nr:prepilin-type N-terminal cleavage/methylation domain-containing protein [Alphaproteobacteria bacterium]
MRRIESRFERSRARGRGTGFTLLETLVVLVVLGFLMVGLTQGVRAGIALWDTQSRRIGATAELDTTARLLRSLLTGLTLTTSGRGAAEFKGTAGSVSFVGDLPTGLGTTQRADITLELRQGHLILSWTPHRHEVSLVPPPAPVQTDLLGGVDRLELAYWGAPSPGQPSGWLGQWDGRGVPQLIRVRLVFSKNDTRRFPDLIAAPEL